MPAFTAQQAVGICKTALRQQTAPVSSWLSSTYKGFAIGTDTTASSDDTQYVVGDTKYLAVLSYGTAATPYDVNAFTVQKARGASLVMFGNNNSLNAGDLRLETGGGSASSVLTYLNGGATTSWMVGAHTTDPATDTVYWSINSNTLTPGSDNAYNFAADSTRPATAYLRIADIKTRIRFSVSNGDIIQNTSDGSDNGDFRATGGGDIAFDGSRGATLRLGGNEKVGETGLATIDAGAVAAGDIDFTTHHASAGIKVFPNGTETIRFIPSFLFQAVAAGNESTGAGSAALGSNSPAVTNTAPYTWEKVKTSDGSTGYIPVWK